MSLAAYCRKRKLSTSYLYLEFGLNSRQTLDDRIKSGNWSVARIDGQYQMYNSRSAIVVDPPPKKKVKNNG